MSAIVCHRTALAPYCTNLGPGLELSFGWHSATSVLQCMTGLMDLLQCRKALPMLSPVPLAAAHKPVWSITTVTLHVGYTPLPMVCFFYVASLVSDPVHILSDVAIYTERPRHAGECPG